MRHSLIVSSCLLLAACAQDGGFATKGKPIDPVVTFHNSCSGAKVLHQLWLAAVTASGGKIELQDVVIEADAWNLINAICQGPVPGDLTGALLSITAAAAPIGALVSKYS